MREQKLSAGIEISKMEKGQWSFGVCFSHYFVKHICILI